MYTYWRSSCSYRVRIALALKGIAYTSVPVNLLEGAQTGAAHVARSPTGYVPCLEVDGVPFVESVALVELLDDLVPTPRLYPEGPADRARVRALVEVINAGTQPLQNLSVLQRLSAERPVQVEWSRHWIAKGLGAFEGLLQRYESQGRPRGRYAFGDAPGAADVFLVPQVYNARRFSVDLSPWPRLAAAAEAAEAHPLVAAAAPERQPDAVPA